MEFGRMEMMTPTPGFHGLEAIDDSTPFYEAVRDYVFSLVVFLLLYTIAYIIFTHLLKKKTATLFEQLFADSLPGPATSYGRRRRELDRNHDPTLIPLILCSFAAAVSIGTALLVLVEISINDLRFLPRGWMAWLTSEALAGYWNRIFWGSNVSLVLVLFAYFYCEAEGFSATTRTLSGRLLETVITVVIVFLFIFGFFYLAQEVWGVKEEAYLPFSFSFISFLGSIYFLAAAPYGFVSLINKAVRLRTSINLWDGVQEDIEYLQLEKSSLQHRLSNLKDERDRDSLSRELLVVAETLQNRRKELGQYPVLRNVWCVVLLALTVFLSANIVLRVLLRSWYNSIIPYLGHTLFKIFVVGTLDPDIQVTRTVIELCLCLYFIIASFVGAVEIPYSLHSLRGIRLKSHSTSMQVICIYTLLFLVLSASVPTVTNTLGITRFDLLGHYNQQWGQYTVVTYNAFFLISSSITLVSTARRIWKSW